MQILLANAKIMFDKTDRKPLSTPTLPERSRHSGCRNGKDGR